MADSLLWVLQMCYYVFLESHVNVQIPVGASIDHIMIMICQITKRRFYLSSELLIWPTHRTQCVLLGKISASLGILCLQSSPLTGPQAHLATNDGEDSTCFEDSVVFTRQSACCLHGSVSWVFLV